MNAADLATWCTEHGVRDVVVGSADTTGAWIGKRVAGRELPALLDGPGVAFSDVFLVITRDGENTVEPPGGAEQPTYFPNRYNGYPDVFLRPDPDTARLLPWHEATAALYGSFTLADGRPVPVAPRNVLAAQVARARDAGLTVRVASEFEFYLLQGTADDLAREGYPVRPIAARPYTYMAYRSGVDAELLQYLCGNLETAGVRVEAVNPETGPGQYEINIGHAEAMRAADDAFCYKNALKELAAGRGLTATFMAKPVTDWAGSSCHLHQSVWSADGEPLLWDDDAPVSELGGRFLAGQLATMAELAALFAPTVNSYKRLTPYSWAATTVSWGVDNRSTGLRVVGETPSTRRIEHRLGGADVNPYLAVAACLAGGVHGVEKGLAPADPYQGDAYADGSLPPLPRTFAAALDLFEASDVARRAFGDDFVEHFTAMKRWEVERMEATVTDWERAHYLETA